MYLNVSENNFFKQNPMKIEKHIYVYKYKFHINERKNAITKYPTKMNYKNRSYNHANDLNQEEIGEIIIIIIIKDINMYNEREKY